MRFTIIPIAIYLAAANALPINNGVNIASRQVHPVDNIPGQSGPVYDLTGKAVYSELSDVVHGLGTTAEHLVQEIRPQVSKLNPEAGSLLNKLIREVNQLSSIVVGQAFNTR